jgi:hypothetical protein
MHRGCRPPGLPRSAPDFGRGLHRIGVLLKAVRRGKEIRSSFLKKRSKRLLRMGFGGAGNSAAQLQKFFGSFFQKRTTFLPGRAES